MGDWRHQGGILCQSSPAKKQCINYNLLEPGDEWSATFATGATCYSDEDDDGTTLTPNSDPNPHPNPDPNPNQVLRWVTGPTEEERKALTMTTLTICTYSDHTYILP